MTDEHDENVPVTDTVDNAEEAVTEAAESGWGRSRRKAMAETDLSPASLVGSYFFEYDGDGLSTDDQARGVDRVVSWGMIVAEPVAGAFLVEFWNELANAPTYQRLVKGEEMLTGWRFFDTEEEMRAAYALWTREGVNDGESEGEGARTDGGDAGG